MRLLLDENVPAPLAVIVKSLLRRDCQVSHVVDEVGWAGTKDVRLFEQAAAAGFHAILTNDAKQMRRQAEVEAIARSGIHRIEYPVRDGLAGVGLTIAAVCSSLPAVLVELSSAGGQRLVKLKAIDPRRDHRYVVTDPGVRPPAFWPHAESGTRGEEH